MGAPSWGVVEQQRQLWEELAAELERAQAKLLARDLPGFAACTHRQRACCEQLAALAGEAGTAAGEGRVAAILAARDAARRQVRHRSRVQGALLRRALHSLRILRHLAELGACPPAGSGGRDPRREEG